MDRKARAAWSANKEIRMAQSEAEEGLRHLEKVKFWGACERRDTEQISHMLQTGAVNIDYVKDYLWNILKDNNTEVARFLFANSLDVNTVSVDTVQKWCSLGMLETLVEEGWDIENKGPDLLM